MPFKSDNARKRYFAENIESRYGKEPPNKRICPLCKGSKPTNQKICIPCLRKKQVGTIFHPDYKPPFNEKLHEQHSRGNY